MEKEEELDQIIKKLRTEKEISADDLMKCCSLAYPILNSEPNVIKTESPITLLGDVHGDYDDVLQIFEIFGDPPETRYVFVGDFVDRGDRSVQTIGLLLAYKAKYPNDFFLVRGNHEGINMTPNYGFYQEILSRFSDVLIYNVFIDLFSIMPLAILIDKNIFSVHGGLSPLLETIEQLDSFPRKSIYTTSHQIIKDILWSDPDESNGILAAQREGGQCWGPDITERFIERNHLKLVVRGHENVKGGYRWNHNKRCLTIFSSPSYIDAFHEAAALEIISPTEMEITKFRPKAWEDNLYDSMFANIFPL